MQGLSSDEVGYPKTRNPRGNNPNPTKSNPTRTRRQIPEPDPKPDIQTFIIAKPEKTRKPEGNLRVITR